MTHYKSNVRDIKFNLFEVLNRSDLLGEAPYADLDRETADAVLDEVDHLTRTKLADSYVESDREPPVFDPQTHTAPLPEAFKKSYQDWMNSEFYKIGISADVGGQPAPPSLRWGMNELILGANPAVYMYASGPKFGEMLFQNGTDRDKKIGTLMFENRWGASMVLTEPDAGSDVGAARTKATPQPDGSWHIEGVKRFITCAEHDLSDQIIHVVLARPTGVARAGGPGTKGLSMFIVPKYDFDVDTGELGERNGVYATGLEHKMGLRVSNTCELTFGADKPAKGWLLGEVHDGIAQMFQIIEDARMMVGSKAIATLSTGYLNALEYAKSRVQGADLTQNTDKTAPRVAITHHPDIRRSLLTQKSYAEGMRALMLYTASIQDRVALAAARGESDDDAKNLNDLLLPIVKGYGSERSWVLLGTESLQTFGGSGYLADYPLEQYVRDAKIDTLYEGTTAIQGQDLFFRKIIRNRGRALGQLQAEINAFLDAESANAQLKEERRLLRQALADVEAIGTTMAEYAMAGDPRSGGDSRNLYLVGLNTTRLLMALGDVLCGWLLLRGAEVALAALDGELPESERQFYQGKLASARWFAHTVLPKLAAERGIAEATDQSAMELPEAAF